ncbi:hypothetical protein [Streptomyces oceani]|uniref:hypothetical protein n=1 Tax=Streptomyces oceani TaxID=1075402 RepID=UPI001FCCDEC0|nr:hypothetical protein [Streptomyces oceani]
MTEKGDTGNDFSLISHNICNSEAETVYFAGRPTHLRLFALKLAEVPCEGKRYTVVSGSGVATLDQYMSERDWEKLARGGSRQSTVRVQYVAPAHPDAWERELRELRAVVDTTRGDIGPVQLEDSRTILVYDGVRTIAEAVFLANAQTSEDIPSRNRVAAMWSRLESAHRVVGASGWICLTNGGNPYDKPVAVVELDPRSRGLSYVGLAWPEGKPQPAECVVPSRSD